MLPRPGYPPIASVSGVPINRLGERGYAVASGQVLYKANTTATAYSLVCDPGVYAITGVAATVVATRFVSADPGVYALTGVAATTVAGRVVSADPGSYALTGVAATLLTTRVLTADPGSYALTGAAATLVEAAGGAPPPPPSPSLPVGLAYVPDHVPSVWLNDEEEALLCVLLGTAL